MKLAIGLPYTDSVAFDESVELVREAERLGFEAVFVAEVYGYDSVSLMAALAVRTERIKIGAGILNIYSRSPTLLAQTAASLDMLSGGRFILGLGSSGPQVVEGWHGVPFEKPLQRTREVVDVIRTALRRERVVYDGEVVKLSKGLKLITHPVRPEIPIVIAALGPKTLELTGEIADGWMPTIFHPDHMDVFSPHLEAGLARRGRTLADLMITPMVPLVVHDDVDLCRALIRPYVALYVGGMGSRERNFYNQLVQRYGYVEEARQVQELYLAGDKQAAAALLPDELIDATSVIGSPARCHAALGRLERAGVTMPILGVAGLTREDRLTALEAVAPVAATA
ncbi:MAG TPA: LLM class F420-dependent oxidoreductase [Candidatus Dormibacteraeota bacterium]|nr:LLM class F420-dependent oxidoreductase [Candidatus Dormibacteraeota bacterium]